MGVYAHRLFPRLMDRALRSDEDARQRRAALAGARGRVLEVGYGTGLNFPWYPGAVRRIVAGDPERMMDERVGERAGRAPAPVHRVRLDAAALPFPNDVFDTVVSTWTLCSIRDLHAALAELRRVLRPEGRFLFLEHGASDAPLAAALQVVLNPLQQVVGRGCHLTRRLDAAVRETGFELLELERFRFPGRPRTFADMYRGVARPESAGNREPGEATGAPRPHGSPRS